MTGLRRRRVLQGAGASLCGFTAGCVSTSTSDVRIPVLRSRDSTVLSRNVPGEWYSHAQDVRRTRRSLEEFLSGDEGVAGVKVVRSADRYGGLPGLDLTIELYQEDTSLPEEVEGFSIRTELALDRGLSACYNSSDFDPIPGGVVIEPVEGDHFGTACCRVFDGDDPRLLTAAHLWNVCGRNPTGEPLYQNSRRIGEVSAFHRGSDVAVVEPDDQVRLADTIKLEDARQLPMAGHLTEWGILLFLSEGRSVFNMGVSSGLTEGRLSAAYIEEGWNHCVDFAGHGVEAEYFNAEGDSGGPVFYRHNGSTYLVATQQMWLNQAGTDCGEQNIRGQQGRGTAAHYVQENLGLAYSL